MEKIRLQKSLERTIAHTDELESQLGDIAYGITVRARANLAAHRNTGEHKVTQTKGRVDHYVNLVGPAALSIEEGHVVSGFYAGPGAGE
jgi:hypothetical protein